MPITPTLPWNQTRFPTLMFDAAQTDYLKQRGVRLVSYCCCFEYIHAMESVLFCKPAWGENLFVNQRYDDIWMIPQVDSVSRSYFEVLRGQSARRVIRLESDVSRRAGREPCECRGR